MTPRLRVQHPQPRYVLWRQYGVSGLLLSALHHICLNNPFLCLLISTGLFHFSYLWCATRLCFEALSDSVISAPSAALFENFSGHLLSQLRSYTFSYISPLSLKVFLSYRSCRGAVTLLKGMGDIIFQLNKEKTEVLVCAPDRFMSKVMETLDGFAIFAKSFSCGVTRLLLWKFISQVCSCF